MPDRIRNFLAGVSDEPEDLRKIHEIVKRVTIEVVRSFVEELNSKMDEVTKNLIASNNKGYMQSVTQTPPAPETRTAQPVPTPTPQVFEARTVPTSTLPAPVATAPISPGPISEFNTERDPQRARYLLRFSQLRQPRLRSWQYLKFPEPFNRPLLLPL